MEKIKVHIVEDQRIQRAGLNATLGMIKEVEIFGESCNGKEFLQFLKQYLPDVVLMDIVMPEMNGPEATLAALKQFPELKILVLSSYDDDKNLFKMIDAGARGYILKTTDELSLAEAIKTVHGGKNYFSPVISVLLNKKFAKKRLNEKYEGIILSSLTQKEFEMIQFICRGYTDREISEMLNIRLRTAQGRRSKLLAKTACKNTASFIAFAIKTGLYKL